MRNGSIRSGTREAGRNAGRNGGRNGGRGVGRWTCATTLPAIAATNEILLASDGAAADQRSGPLEILSIGSVVLVLPLVLLLWKWRGWRPRRIDGRSRPTPWRGTAMESGLTFVLCLLVGPAVAMVAGGLLPRPDAVLSTGIDLWLAAAAGLLLALPVGLMAVGRPRPVDAAPRSPGWAILPAGLLAFLLVFLFVQATMLLGGHLHTLLSDDSTELLGHQTLQLLNAASRDLGWWVVVTGVVVAVPWQEEVLFRGLLQQTFRKAGVEAGPAILVTAVVFTVLHMPAIPVASRLSVLPGLFVLSIGLGLLRERTGRVSTCVVAHGAFNLVNVLLSFTIEPTG